MSSSRLPGVYFETVVPPVPEPLPRLDIAAFVGFAPSGPLDIPVAVEDASRFQEIFGKDQRLAWDSAAGETVYAQLPPAVRAFFRNGGRRCWVVRVAGNSKAASNSFLIPGMLQASPEIPYQAGGLVARSEGSWSDDLMLNATVSFQPVAADPPQQTNDGLLIVLYSNSAPAVSPGDLLQVSFDRAPGSSPSGNMPILFVPVTAVQSATVQTSGRTAQATTVTSDGGFWFLAAEAGDFTDQPGSPPFGGTDPTVTWLAPPDSVSWLTPPRNAELWIGGWGIAADANAPKFVVVALRAQAEEIAAGSWLRVRLNAARLPTGAQELLLLVDSVRGTTAAATGVPTSPATGEQETVEIVVSGAWWVLDHNAGWKFNLSAPRVDVVTLELWVRDGSGKITTLSDLGLSSAHPFYLGYLPTDAQLYARSDNPVPPPGSALWAEVDHPRFPLAMSLDSASAATAATGQNALPVFLPLGIPGLVNPDFYQPAILPGGTALYRDGLDLGAGPRPGLPASLFLDPDLADCNAKTLLTAAFHKQYQLRREDGPGPAGEPLVKMHAVLPLEEISLLAVPDAQHLGWTKSSAAPEQLLDAPTLESISSADAVGQISLIWSEVAGATSYTLEQSADPQFSSSSTVWQGPGQAVTSPADSVQSGSFPQPSDCPGTVYFRVSASDGVIAGPWSNTLAQTLPQEAFQLCAPNTIDAPTMAPPAASRGRVILDWSDAEPNLDGYELQIAYEPAFALPFTLFKGTDTHFEVWSNLSRTAYFRVSANRGTQNSPWSTTQMVEAAVPESETYLMNSGASAVSAAGQVLLDIHQAMLRLSAARGDVFSVLGLPREFDAQSRVSYKSLLLSRMLSEDDDSTLSYAGIYFPWLIVRDAADNQPGAIRSVAPEATILGSIAALTIASGAWLAPGNQLLKGVVDLDPPTTDQAPYIFFDNHLNLVVQESPGFLAMSSFTLSPSSQLEDINVRRLLILLRRLALREGVDYVFQPNDPGFWRIVQRRFEEVLGGLFLQGAFAGTTPAESFMVRTDSSVNPPESVEQGRFIVEIRVAPSLPLEFLTVRLLQSGGDLSFSEGT